MNLLALDTSTEIMSIAVQRDLGAASRIWQHSAPGGAQTSTQLVPAIQALMGQADLQFGDLSAIVLGGGPGSFTGLRTAFSVAQGLGFGADVPLLPVDTLMVVAEEARWQLGAPPNFSVTALLDARMDELYASSYCFESGSCRLIKRCGLIKPEYLDWNEVDVLAGNVFVIYGKRLPHGAQCVTVMPTATALLRLAPRLMASGACVPADQALPTYIRDKVAQTTLERSLVRTAP